MKSVGEFDQDDADVFGHRDNHLANRLGLRVVPILNFVELGHSVDEQCDFITKISAHVIQRIRRIFDRVVQ